MEEVSPSGGRGQNLPPLGKSEPEKSISCVGKKSRSTESEWFDLTGFVVDYECGLSKSKHTVSEESSDEYRFHKSTEQISARTVEYIEIATGLANN